ncbi:MAG TPA: hypothetical protein PLO71_08130, partial [Thauera phenylacetica]|nr:hypothetical protein [Thauera phenylacetica]
MRIPSLPCDPGIHGRRVDPHIGPLLRALRQLRGHLLEQAPRLRAPAGVGAFCSAAFSVALGRITALVLSASARPAASPRNPAQA